LNSLSRSIFIIGVIIFAVILIWPNIGERFVHVYTLPHLTETQKQESFTAIENFINKNYKDRYFYSKKVESNKLNKNETYYLIRGNFIQAAFLNELSRLPHIDGERITVEKMWVEKKLKAKPFKLGLDLQGGMNLLLEADFEEIKKQVEKKYPPKKIEALKNKIAKEKSKKEKENLEYELKRILEAKDFSLEKRKAYITSALEIIRGRVDKTGVSEPLIRIQGQDKIEISLPGVASPEKAKKLISTMSTVEYYLAEPYTKVAGGERPGKYASLAQAEFKSFKELKSELSKELFIEQLSKKIELPDNLQIMAKYFKNTRKKNAKLEPMEFMVLDKLPSLQGKDIESATDYFDRENYETVVSFQLSSDGKDKFCDLTKNNSGRRMAIVIDKKIRSAPNINDPICRGRAQISGSFSRSEAKDLAIIIKEGSLPVPMKIVEERSIGPSLGLEAIEKGLDAIAIGFVAVVIFMIIYYHIAGIMATFVLLLNLLFMSAVLALLDFTITLPGLAGVVLTIGMAVDANVIIYERMREELTKGKSLKVAVAQGFERATLTILDSNLTTMLAAVVLLQFGVGPIKGFAVTLFIGILTSLFTSLFITKTFFYTMVYDFNFKFISLGFGKYRKILKGKA